MNDLSFSLPTLLILAPAAGGFIAMSMLTRRAAGITGVLTFLVQAALIVMGMLRLDGRGPESLVPTQSTPWFDLLDINYTVAADSVALGLIALTTLVTFCASMFAWYADRPRPAAFQGLLWLTAAALCGLFVARDLVVFYVFFELMLVPLLFLVGAWGGEQRIKAAMTMFIYTLVGSLLMLVGIIAVGIRAGTFDLVELATLAQRGDDAFTWWIFASFVLAFAIKAPLVPFHGWLPLAYRESPAEVTVMLSALVSKAAFFGFLVVVLPLFPDYLDGPAGDVLTWFALAGLLYGSLTAFRQPDARGVVAYSSLAQMGLIVLGLSVYLGQGGQQGVGGAYLQTINHGLISAALFLLVGIVELRTGSGLLSRLGGLATGRPVLATLTLIVSMCALAVPGSNNFAGELTILAGAFRGPWDHAWIWGALGSLAVVLAAMYVLRLLSAMLHTPGDGEELPGAAAGGDLRGFELVAVVPLVVAMLALSVWPNMAERPMNERAVPLPPTPNSNRVDVTATEPAEAATTEHHGG